MPRRLSQSDIKDILQKRPEERVRISGVHSVDVFIAGSGPIACSYARAILEQNKNRGMKLVMADIGSQDDPVVGKHQKNSIKYQKDMDSFVNVIKGDLQPISVSPVDTFIPSLGGDAWTPGTNEVLIFQGNNPNQDPRKNLKASAVTRKVGGMGTHWDCASPTPHQEERVNNPIEKSEFDQLLERAHSMLNVHPDQYDGSIRHTVVKNTLLEALGGKTGNPRGIQNLPLGVERRKENSEFVTWTGSNTVLGDAVKDERFQLWPETRVTELIPEYNQTDKIGAVLVRNLRTNDDVLVTAKTVILACGAVGTPQILDNSGIRGPALGRYLCEQSIAFCQIVLRREIVDSIASNPEFKARVEEHQRKYPSDPLPIPFDDPEPQVMIPYTHDFPYHCQVQRDASSYGDIGSRADQRVVVDLRFFGKQDVNPNNRVYFGQPGEVTGWQAGVTDIYGMPQPTFDVTRSPADDARDHRMMRDMTEVANVLGAFLPGSQPQFMDPGTALHLTGTTRIGKDPNTSVADPNSKVHGFKNLWVGGNGCIPDSMGSSPSMTSMAIALKGAGAVVEYLATQK